MTLRHLDRLPPFDRLATRTITIDEMEVEHTFWMGRHDFTGREDKLSTNTFLTLDSTRYYVRDIPGVSWEGSDIRFRADGRSWLVKGVSRMGTRGSVLELLCG